jgi:hypothetical protein
MTIEQRLAKIIQAFHADALYSAALIAALHNRSPGHTSVARGESQPSATNFG